MKLGSLYRAVRDRFRAEGIETADLDARLLVSGILKLSPGDLIIREADEIGAENANLVEAGTLQRLSGMPVGRILGTREFFGLEFRLNSDTLEPRPDTEILVETVLDDVKDRPHWTFLDLGTGSGAIAVALAANSPGAFGIAADISLNALEAARANAEANGVGGQLAFAQANYAAPFAGSFDWIVSNPPYIASRIIEELDAGVREHDPMRALDGGEDGLDAYRVLIPQAKPLLSPKGRVALEIGFDQGGSVSNLLDVHGYRNIEIIADLSGMDRVVVAAIG
ncbi:peptide chain release factor N(5)-glutamine methyltransferase [Roseibium sediminis]|uniref:peptide chain release factor N(5)-glutamine methyltransferase n=1 Tax=Roseibium sediminis TaxID=1775174 RepID=UPI00123CA18E|nr:peptide chain release factor N(5)-glutamine methyltransferase [Roseibium sediminis]